MQSRSIWAAFCGGSLRTQPKLVNSAGSTVTMQNQSGISVTQETSGCPVAFIHLCDSIFKLSQLHVTLNNKAIELLLLFEEHAKNSVLVMQCMPRNKNACAVIQSHNHNLQITSSKNQGKKSHSMSGKLVIQLPAEIHTLTSKEKT